MHIVDYIIFAIYLLLVGVVELPDYLEGIGLDPSIYGMLCSLLFYVAASLIVTEKNTTQAKIG